ncbi:MAG: glycosyltransferase [Crenarchaeota archaeon]|nr:glycosyltransferase [Thermoproteota archaeon]
MKGRAFIVAPNIGLHMGLGGGVRTVLAMAKTLEEIGYEPYLVALKGYSLSRLSLIHGVKLEKSKPLYFLGEGKPLKLPFPMQISLLKLFLEKVLMRYRPQITIFNDDMPKIDERLLRATNVFLYSHFPYAARVKFNITDAYETPPSRDKVYLDILYRKLLKRLIYIDHAIPDVMLISNSTITNTFMKLLWHRDPITIYPPLIVDYDFKKSQNNKENLIMVLATIQPNKRIGDVIKAFSKLRYSKARLVIVGHKSSERYVRYLSDLIKQLKIESKVTFMTDVCEHEKWNLLAKSKVIISAAHFEPFGINIVEGMYMNNIPIVYKGSFSGPWIDITNKGKYGLGFRDVEELAELIDSTLNDYNYIVQKLSPATRAREFSYQRFREQFANLL